MKRLLVLGAGTAGTMVVNKLRKRLPKDQWQITVVDESTDHHYQPGYLFLPFGRYTESQLTKPTQSLITSGVNLVLASVEKVHPEDAKVELATGELLAYDYLVIATGSTPRPEETPGMKDALWQKNIFDFYTLDGAKALGTALDEFDRGRLVVHVAETPIKCPVAPMEFAFLADAFFSERGSRDRISITYVTPLDGAFTKPVASRHLGSMLAERNIGLETDFMIEQVDNETRELVSFDERRVPFDLLVTVPVNMGADFVGASGLGDELNYVKVDPTTFLSRKWDNIFAVGDAADLPTSKAGSVAHFAVDIFCDNFLEHIEGRPMLKEFDGHANCFVESGDGKALLIDFNYDVEPLPGKYPIAGVGPFSLLEESRINHTGKLAFKWLYWNALLPGRPIPVPTLMSMSGKKGENE